MNSATNTNAPPDNAPPEINFHAVGVFDNGKIQKIRMSTSKTNDYYETIADIKDITNTQKTQDGYYIKAESTDEKQGVEDVVKNELASLNSQTSNNTSNSSSGTTNAAQTGADPNAALSPGSGASAGGSRRRSSKRTQKRRQRKQRKSRKSV